MRALALALVILSAAVQPSPPPATATPVGPLGPRTYQDPSLPIYRRVTDLLGRMTLEEKVAQVQSVNWQHTEVFDPKTRQFSVERARKLIPHGIGQITRPGDRRDARQAAELANAVQRFLVEKTRLGIPAIMHEEALHGFVAAGATSFPQAIALGATFDPALVEEVFTTAARQMRARGAHQALAPVVDVARDPRWGRFEETYGEDPYLVSRMGVAAIRGFQGHVDAHGAGAGTRIDGAHVMPTAKHFAVHGTPEGGRNTAPGNYSERVVREVFFPPFEAAVREADVAAVMASYNEIDGIPAHANRWLLQDVLRREWGFGGLVVSDYFGVAELERKHHVVADLPSAGRKALDAGVDIELPEPEGFATLAGDVRAGRVPQARLDQAVARVLAAKFRLGLFEAPYVDAEHVPPESAADRALARRAADEAIVLLKNDKGLLPLDAARLRSIAVIGPNAAVCRLGGYSDVPARAVSVLDGIKARVGDKVRVVGLEGCGLTAGNRGWTDDRVELADAAVDARLVAEAARAAAAADVALLVLGQNEQLSREAWADNHRGDRGTLELVGRQMELARAVVAAGRPTIVLLVNGSPLAIPELARTVPAVVEGFYLGEETGAAVADVLFGDVSPSGRLPVTFARDVGALPAYYNHKPSARRPQLFEEPGPLWPFGFGLSYASFRYDGPRVRPERIAPDGRATVSVTVTNTSKRAADEVVQLYIHDLVSSVTRPVQELRGFRRVSLRPGESRQVDFVLGPAELGFFDERMQRVVEPGAFEVMVGGNSADVKHAQLEVVSSGR
jgi:beta-glucosidase